MILGLSYKDARGALVPMEKVEQRTEGAFHTETGEKLVEFPAKMSKSLKNVVNPDDVIREYGADSMRLYEMFMGPLEAVKPWNTKVWRACSVFSSVPSVWLWNSRSRMTRWTRSSAVCCATIKR